MKKIRDTSESLISKIESYQKRKSELEKDQRISLENKKEKKAVEISAKPLDLTRKRNERNLMSYPFCSMSKKKRLEKISYVSPDGTKFLEVTANHEYGMAKIWDFDILRYALSKAGEVRRLTGVFPERVEFSGYEVLKAIGKSDSGVHYAWLKKALKRLASTTYYGNIFAAPEGEKRTSIFNLISADFLDETDELEKITITFNKRLVESVLYSNNLLEIDPRVLKEKSGTKKRLLELVAVRIGGNQEWKIRLDHLADMCVHGGELKKLKQQIKSYDLPWDIFFRKAASDGKDVVVFSKKKIKGSISLPYHLP